MSVELNQWLAFIDMERGDLLDMAKKENKKIREAVEEYEVLTGDEEVKRLTELRLMSKLEENSALATSRAKGAEEGIKQAKEDILKRLVKMKFSEKQIHKATGILIEKIKKLTS